MIKSLAAVLGRGVKAGMIGCEELCIAEWRNADARMVGILNTSNYGGESVHELRSTSYALLDDIYGIPIAGDDE